MSTYHSLINEGKERLYKAGQGEQALRVVQVLQLQIRAGERKRL